MSLILLGVQNEKMTTQNWSSRHLLRKRFTISFLLAGYVHLSSKCHRKKSNTFLRNVSFVQNRRILNILTGIRYWGVLHILFSGAVHLTSVCHKKKGFFLSKPFLKRNPIGPLVGYRRIICKKKTTFRRFRVNASTSGNPFRGQIYLKLV